MGLTDSASAFQRWIQQTLVGLPSVIVYIDDIIVFGEDQETHDRNLKNVLQRFPFHTKDGSPSPRSAPEEPSKAASILRVPEMDGATLTFRLVRGHYVLLLRTHTPTTT